MVNWRSDKRVTALDTVRLAGQEDVLGMACFERGQEAGTWRVSAPWRLCPGVEVRLLLPRS